MSDSSPTGKDLPSGWSVSPLEDVADILDGKRVPVNAKERETRTGKVPYYGATGQVGWIDDYLFDEELVLLGEDGAPFLDASKPKAYVIRGKSWVNNHAHVLRAKDGTPNAYLKYFLDRFDYHGFVTGTTRLKLTQGSMRQIPIPLPSPEDRKRIVAEIEKQFSRLDEAVASLKRTKANLKRYKAAVLKAAVEGKLTEDWRKQHPDIEPASKLLERILAERRARWSGRRGYKEPKGPDTEALPSLPRGWEWATAEQLTDETRAITYGVIKLGPHKPDGIPVLRSSDVRSLYLDMREVKRVAPEIAGQFKRTFLKGNEVLVTVRGTLGGVVVAPQQCAGFNISREVAMLAFVDEKIAKAIAIFIASAPVQRWLMQRTKGIAYTGINIETLKELPLPLPSIAEQHQIVAEVERRLSVIDELEATVEANLIRADHLQQAILHNAFSGTMSSSEEHAVI